MKVAVLSGSARSSNNTLRVARAIRRILQSGHEVKLIDFREYDIPFLAQGGLKPNSLTSFQQELIGALTEAQIIILISPEYNWSTTPEILNMLHSLGEPPFGPLFENKVYSMVGVSTGKGGRAPVVHLMQILNKLISFGNHESMVSARIFESHFTKTVLDEEGNSLGNELYDKGLEIFCNYTLRIALRWFR